MELFSTPVLTFRSSENQESAARKTGPAKILHRKPFLDRPVNSKTPTTNKLPKAAASVKQQISPKNQSKQEDLEAYDYIFSFKDEKNDECDIYPKPVQLGTEGVLKVLHNYCGNNRSTPPPSPINSICIDFIFTKLPDITEYCKRNEDILFETISDDIEIPTLDASSDFFYI